eukprot:m.87722 g.87722  ORF g.87722 m.87722 type:complete len:99 (+) comp16419_c0_seq1:193-489(+)
MGCSPTHFCGPKCSSCCMILSVWGVIFLVIVGALFQSKARAFIVDIEEGHRTATAMEDAGRSCYIAAGMYVVTFALSFWQMKVNSAKASIATRYESFE